MHKYIGVKMVEAEPMDSGRATGMGLRAMGVTDREPGYLVRYPDGYESWSPKETFEDAYLPLHDIEGQVITAEDAYDFASSFLESKLGEKTAVVQVRCPTGFEITETAACVDPTQYNQDMGREIALEKIKNRIWEHLGFVLQWARNGLRATVEDTEETNTKGEC